nr:hypothetical protein [Tanacetum cinerariifolium]
NQFRQYAGQNAGNPTGYNDVIGNQVIQNAVQNPKVQNDGNQNGLTGVQGNGNQNRIGNENLVAAHSEGNAAGQNGNQIRCYNCRGQASTSGTQTDSASFYDTDGSAEYTELLEFIHESHQVPQHDNDVISEDTSVEQDKLLDKQIQLEKRIKELNNIVLKTGQSIQTIHMLSLKPDSFYHTEQSLYDGKVLLEKHDPPVVHDSEETLQLV